MRVLVTGASGFVGRALIPRLTAAGHGGIVSGRSPPASLEPGWEVAKRSEVLDGGFPVGRVDAVVHLEVKHHVFDTDVDTNAEMMAVNAVGTEQWLAWAAARNVDRFIFASSIKAVRPEPGETDEDAALEPFDPYGRSKAEAEAAVRRWAGADSSRAAAILRLAPVYGPGNTANLAAFARQVLRGQPCFVGRGQTRKSIVSLKNSVAAITWALDSHGPGCEIFNVSDQVTRTVRELADLIASVAGAPRPRGVPLPVARLGASIGDIARRVLGRPVLLDSRRLRAMLETTVFPADKLGTRGFVHPQETEAGIAELVAWLTTPATVGETRAGQSS